MTLLDMLKDFCTYYGYFLNDNNLSTQEKALEIQNVHKNMNIYLIISIQMIQN